MALTSLGLNDNFITTLDSSIFHPTNHPTALHNLAIHNNPLEFDSLCWIKEAEGATWITVTNPGNTVCSGTGAMNCRAWDEVTTQDLCASKCLSVCLSVYHIGS